jgi:hypothetical protein
MLDLVQLHRLQQGSDILSERYAELVAAADCSAYGSPAAEAKAQFELDFVSDAAALQRQLEREAAAAWAAAARGE